MSDICQKFSFMPDNVVPASTITGTATNAAFPLNNLKHESRSHSTRFENKSTIEIDFSFSGALIDTVVIPNINIAIDSSIKIIWSHNGTDVYDSSVKNPNGLTIGGLIPIGEFTIGLHYWLQRDDSYTSNGITDSDDPKLADHVKVIITNPSQSMVDIQMVMIGKKVEFSTNYQWGFSLQQIEKTLVKNTAGGSMRSASDKVGRELELPLKLNDEDAAKLMRLERLHHNKIWWFDAMPWKKSMEQNFEFIGNIEQIKYGGESYDSWAQQITVKEV